MRNEKFPMRNKKQLQDYFNEVDEATDCEEPRAKTVNLYRLYLFGIKLDSQIIQNKNILQ